MSKTTKKLCFKVIDEAKKLNQFEDEDEIESYLKKDDDNLIVKIDELIICKSRKKLMEEELKEQNISGGTYYLYEDNENKKKSLINKKSRNEKLGDKNFSIFDIEYSGIDIRGFKLYEVIPYSLEQYQNIDEDENVEDEIENEY